MKELIEKAEKLDRDATPGPWDTYENEITAGDNLLFKAGHRSQATAYDMLFVSQARTLLPALAAELRKLTAARVAAEDTAKSYLATSLRLERERDAARKQAAEWEVQAQDMRDRAVAAEKRLADLRGKVEGLTRWKADITTVGDVHLYMHGLGDVFTVSEVFAMLEDVT